MVRCEQWFVSVLLVLSYVKTCHLIFEFLSPPLSPMPANDGRRFVRWLEMTNTAEGTQTVRRSLRDKLNSTLQDFAKFVSADNQWPIEYKYQYFGFLLMLDMYTMPTGHHLLFPAHADPKTELSNSELMCYLTIHWFHPKYSQHVESIMHSAIYNATTTYLRLEEEGKFSITRDLISSMNMIREHVFEAIDSAMMEGRADRFYRVLYDLMSDPAGKRIIYLQMEDLMRGRVDEVMLDKWLNVDHIRRVLIHWPFREIATMSPSEDVDVAVIRRHVIAYSLFQVSFHGIDLIKPTLEIYVNALDEKSKNLTADEYPIEIVSKFADDLGTVFEGGYDEKLSKQWKIVKMGTEVEIELLYLVRMKPEVSLALFFIIDALLTQFLMYMNGWSFRHIGR